MFATATVGAGETASTGFATRFASRLETECDVTERLAEIVSDSRHGAQQRLTEAVAYAASCGWIACEIFSLAPDLIREVELRCGRDKHKRLMLSIIDSEDGNERLQVSYVSRNIAWDRIM